MDPFASSSNGRQKRVLPSRTRRGGPVVGNCDADVMILEHQKRRFETEAIIPPTTPFLLTTNSEVSSGAGGLSEPSITTVTSKRYFDRPDVLKAYREQLTIQTPSFKYVADNPSVGGRFRPRGLEDAQIDTSDGAYERRHRKYETFEKRQRLREKEKLKHEQYKLKERIEQLRVMESSAFLALPASNFSPAPGATEDSVEEDLLNLHINGVATYHHEGERRRKEMLDIALALEERYRVLLPPERLRRLQSQPAAMHENATPTPAPTPGPALSRHGPSDTLESEREQEIYIGDHHDRNQERLRIKLKLGGKKSASQSPAPTTTSRTSRKSAGASVPPGQKPSTRWRSRTPTPPTSPAKLATLSVPPTYAASKSPSPDIQPRETEDELNIDLGREEPIVSVSDTRQSTIASDHKAEVEMPEPAPDSPNRPGAQLPPTPLQKLSPVPDTRPHLAPEIDPALSAQELPTQESALQVQSPPPSTKYPPIDVDEEPAPVSPRVEPSPDARQNVSSSRRSSVTEKELPTTGRRTEDGSRLLELANVVQSISAAPPPTKRQKLRHRGPSKPQGSRVSLPASKGRESTPISLPNAVPAPAPGHEPHRNDGTTAGSPVRSPSPPSRSVSIRLSATPSETAPAPLRASTSSFIPTSISARMPASVSISAATAARRRWKSNKFVDYLSSETGEIKYTRSLLLVAGIRGSVRQTQRHQMAFGVKVPEEISEMQDFRLPDEYLPEEELAKYYAYYGLEAPPPRRQNGEEGSSTLAGDATSPTPVTGEE